MGTYLPEKTATVFISTGELSGEMHGAHLVNALQKYRREQGLPEAIIYGNGSKRMAEAGVQLLFDVATWGEMGILANLLKASTLLRAVRSTARYILSNQPDMVILIDSRVMNTSLAKVLRQQGYIGKIVYYVSPVRWESLYDPVVRRNSTKNKRFISIKQYCDLAIPIYPVSLSTYKELDIPFEFVGHPLCELAKPELTDEQFDAVTGLNTSPDSGSMIIGALPGSRVGEVKLIAPVIFKALALMQEAFEADHHLPNINVVAVLAHDELMDDVLDAARKVGLNNLVMIKPEYVYDLMSRARLMIVKSGTGLHECMLMNVPAIMCYRVSPIMAWIAKHIMKFSMPYFGFPNLLAGRPIVPELIQQDCDHRRIVDLAGSLLYEESERKAMLESYEEVRSMVCRPRPLHTVAKLVNELLMK